MWLGLNNKFHIWIREQRLCPWRDRGLLILDEYLINFHWHFIAHFLLCFTEPPPYPNWKFHYLPPKYILNLSENLIDPSSPVCGHCYFLTSYYSFGSEQDFHQIRKHFPSADRHAAICGESIAATKNVHAERYGLKTMHLEKQQTVIANTYYNLNA